MNDGRNESLRAWPLALTAALVMLATLPGRTQGLSLVTEPLIADLSLDRVAFANVNLWATLLGALFCFPAGWIFDRLGFRGPTVGIILLLSATTIALSWTAGSLIVLFLLLTLTRGLGQSALSIASIAAVGKRFGEKAAMPMAIFAIALSLFFAIAFGLIGYDVRISGWRDAWMHLAIFLAAVIAPIVAMSLRVNQSAKEHVDAGGFSLREALKMPAFWVFAGAAALFNFVSSGFGLFNEAILAERGFGQKTFHMFLGVTTLLSLAGQFLAGWLASRIERNALVAIALLIYAGALGAVAFVSSIATLMCVSVLMGLAGGMIMVMFFSVWPEVFGRAHLGRIQGAAQFVTVLSSAVGPSVFALAHRESGSYSTLVLGIAIAVAIVAAVAARTSAPTFATEASGELLRGNS